MAIWTPASPTSTQATRMRTLLRKPLPIRVLHRAQAISGASAQAQATIDMAWIAYFYLLRPGEHCKAPENAPLTLAVVTLLIGSTHLSLLTATPADLNRATHSSLTFDTQKNRERGEVIAHGRSGHTVACPTNPHSPSPVPPLHGPSSDDPPVHLPCGHPPASRHQPRHHHLAPQRCRVIPAHRV